MTHIVLIIVSYININLRDNLYAIEAVINK
jgi:hypothetical protein